MEMEELPRGHYKEKMENCQCWRECGKTCPAGKAFLKNLYSWNYHNALDPMLVYKICDPCYYQKIEPPNLDDVAPRGDNTQTKTETEQQPEKNTTRKGYKFREHVEGIEVEESGFFAIITDPTAEKAQSMIASSGFKKDPIKKFPELSSKALLTHSGPVLIEGTFYNSEFLGTLLYIAENEKDVELYQKEKDFPLGIKVGSFMGAMAPMIYEEDAKDKPSGPTLEKLLEDYKRDYAVVEKALKEIKEEAAKPQTRKPGFSLSKYSAAKK